MAFTAHEKPEHVHTPRGVLCLDCEEFTPIELERCIACSSSAVALVEEGWDEADKPDPGVVHHVEIDCSTGRIGYTRLTKAELEERAAEAKRVNAAEDDARKEREHGLGLIRAKATDDPAFAALVKHLGIALEL